MTARYSLFAVVVHYPHYFRADGQIVGKGWTVGSPELYTDQAEAERRFAQLVGGLTEDYRVTLQRDGSADATARPGTASSVAGVLVPMVEDHERARERRAQAMLGGTLSFRDFIAPEPIDSPESAELALLLNRNVTKKEDT